MSEWTCSMCSKTYINTETLPEDWKIVCEDCVEKGNFNAT